MKALSLSCSLIMTALLAAPWAGAQTTPPEPAPTSAPAPLWQTSDSAWLNRYMVARERLLAGDFARAKELLDALVSTATNAVDAALAGELQHLAARWATRDLVFVRQADLGESPLSAKAAGERTTDEIAVLYTNAVFYGLGTAGWLAVHTEPDKAAGAILPALGLAGASAGAVAAVDAHSRLRYGVPQSIVSGMYIGLSEGIVWTFWTQSRVGRADEWTAKGVANMIWGLTTAGAVAGGVVGAVRGTTPGRASFVGSAAMWTGLVAGLATGAFSPNDDRQDDRALLAAAVGLNAGAIAGVLAAGPVSPSIARVRFLDLGGIGGGLALGGLYLAAADNDVSANGLMGAIAAGVAGGLTTAWFATAGMPEDRLEAESTTPRASTASRILARSSVSVAPAAGGAVIALRGEM